MKKKIAKLVSVTLMTRVIVDEDATDEQIMLEALPRLAAKFTEDGCCDHIDEIQNDEECPYGTFDEDGAEFFKVLGYKNLKDYGGTNFTLLGDGFTSFKDAQDVAQKNSSKYAITLVDDGTKQ